VKPSDLTIVLPVYGSSIYLSEALRSIEDLIAQGARLLVVDDGIHFDAQVKLNNWMGAQHSDRISIRINHYNLGLFKSLNQNLTFVKTKWFCFCCSDDLFLSDAALKLQQWKVDNHIGLILSKFNSINPDSSLRYDDCRELALLAKKFGNILSPDQMLPALLRYGSLNGNLTGMVIKKSFWDSIGGFIPDWRHAADWEWMVRACSKTDTLLNLSPLVSVRTHTNQLSNLNQGSATPLFESAKVIIYLQKYPQIKQSPLSAWWSACLLQHHMWNLIFKDYPVNRVADARHQLDALNKASPLVLIVLAMIVSVPRRVVRRLMIAKTCLFAESSLN